MDTYLTIAQTVLQDVRRPMTAREILDRAYHAHLVPPQLHGKTQHKTLGARLSEDILKHRDRSLFFRTEPGRFFLRAYLTDQSLPEKFRIPFAAKRRERELLRGKVLSVSRSALRNVAKKERLPTAAILRLFSSKSSRYSHSVHNRDTDDIMVWSFVVVRRGAHVLSYRHGRYREGRDAFLQRRSIGFFTPVVDRDLDLFESTDHGLVAGGIRAVMLDLDLPRARRADEEYRNGSALDCFFLHEGVDGTTDLVGVVHFDCPHWFEPLTRRLAINDLSWLSLDSPVNHLDDFDPWSQRVLGWAQRHAMRA